jgi:hypothetical protein
MKLTTTTFVSVDGVMQGIGGPDEQVLRGREGMNAFAAGLHETWSEWRFVPERFLDAHDCVLCSPA